MISKTILVTGATDGIGFETAKQLWQRGAHILLHGRNEEKARFATKRIASNNNNASITPVWADFSQLSEVTRLANEVAKHVPQLDVLINNAGIYAKQRSVSADGFELTMAVNYYAPFLLTTRLLPLLQKSDAARVVNVSSMTHESAKNILKDLDLVQDWDGYRAYATSKLANILFTRELASRYEGKPLTTNALHPGVVGTKLLRDAFSMSGISCEQGAKTSVFLAIDPKVDGVSGKYFVNCKRAKPSRSADDLALAKELWTKTEESLAAYF